MRPLSKLIFILIFLLSSNICNAIITATISAPTAACLNSSSGPNVTFTASGGTAPYTFTYKINNGSASTIVTTTGNSVNLPISTSKAGSYTYKLVTVEDAAGSSITPNSTATITIDKPTITGVFNVCIGAGTTKLTGSGTPATTSPWLSSNTAVATIDSTGSVKIIAVGTTSITYTDNNGCVTDSTLTVHSLPVVTSLGFDTSTGYCSGKNVQFAPTVTGGTGHFTYAWNFGDGSTSTSGYPTHTYNVLGCGTSKFGVKLTVTDTNGCSSLTQTDSITILQKPDISFSDVNNPLDPFDNCSNASLNPVFTITVGNTSASACVTSYSINWGDSTTTANATFPISHTYTEIGGYNMVITGTGLNGCSNSVTYQIKNATNPSGGIINPGSTQNLCVPTKALKFAIANWGSNAPGTTYQMDFGDDSIASFTQEQLEASSYYNSADPDNSENYPVYHSYITPSCPASTYIITLTVTNACGSTISTTSNVSILKKPITNFTVPSPTCVNTNALFMNNTISGYGTNCTRGAIYTWNFGDGTSSQTGTLSTPPNTNHTYAAAGKYKATLIALNYCGADTTSDSICIEPPLVPKFTLSNTSGCSPLAVVATNTTDISQVCKTPTYNWEVSYNAGNCGTSSNYIFTSGSSSSASPSFSFVNPGTYTLQLSVTNSCGTQTTSQTVTVTQPPTVSINNITTPVCQTFPTTAITPSASVVSCGSAISSYLWSFPGGSPSTSTSADPGTITYSLPGTYTCTLTVTNTCGSTTATSNSFTINPTPTVNSVANQEKCNGESSDPISFTQSPTVPNTVYNWTNTNTSIGLAASGTGNIDSFTFKNNGTSIQTANITVTPTVVATGCTGSPITFTIIVHPTPTVNPVSNQTVCNNSTQPEIDFSSTVSGTQYTWTNSNTLIGLAASGTGNIPAFTATNSTTSPITATIIVTSKDPVVGCTGTSQTFTITVNPTPQPLTLSDQQYCNGIETSTIAFSPNAVAGTTYSWTNSNTSIGLEATGTGNIPAFIPTNGGIAPISGTINVIASANGCQETAQTFTITVNPSPVIQFSPSPQVICSGDNSALVTLDSPTTGATFSWTASIPSGISGAASSGTNTIPIQTLVNSTNGNLIITYTATASLAGMATCNGANFLYYITVNAKPTVTNQSSTICNGGTFTIAPTNGGGNIIPSGTTYSWSTPTTTGGMVTGATAQTAQSSISQTLVNTSSTIATVTYTVTPSANGCTGSPFTVSVTVNPTPTVTTVSNITHCNGDLNNEIDFTGPVAGTTYNWTSSTTAIGIGSSSGVNKIPSFTAVNSTNSPIIATITVTPTANGCTGTSSFFTITVYPTPTINTENNITLCNNEESSAITFSGTSTGTTYSWTNDNQNIGLVASGTGNIGSFMAINSGTTAVLANLTVTPSINGCLGTSTAFTITVNPTPTVVQPGNQTVCNAFQTSAVNFTGSVAGTTYSWINDTPSIGLSATGWGNIDAFTAYNGGASAVTATITVTPHANGCAGNPQSFTITVNPSPVITFSSGYQMLCSGDTSTPVTLNSPTSGVTFSWTASVPSAISGATALSGAGTIPVQTLINNSNTNAVVIYTATASIAGMSACAGASYIYAITIQPKPAITTSQTATICSGGSFAITPTDGGGNIVPAGTTYTWSTPVVTGGSVSGATVQTTPQSSVSQTLVNTSNTIATVTYTVTPSANGCTGSPFTVTVTVNPTPTVNTVSNITHCNGDTNIEIDFAGTVAGTTYNWSSNNTSIGIGASGSNIISAFTATNFTNAPITATITVIPTANGCTGASKTFTITVYPTPTVNPVGSITLCNNAQSGAISFTGATTGTIYSWTNDNSSIGLGSSGTGNITSFAALNTGTSAVTANITVTPSINGCAGASTSFTITVNPTPTVAVPNNQTVCNGASTAAVSFSGAVAGTTFTWVNNTSSIGLAATGSGDIGTFTAINGGTSNVMATITVTPHANGCDGTAKSFTITVHPTPTVNSVSPQTVCNNSTQPEIDFSSTVSGTQYTWTNSDTSIGLGNSGTGNIPAFTAKNTGTTAVQATITVTPFDALSCSGTPISFTITVNPTPQPLVSLPNQEYCNGVETSSITFTANAVAGTSYNWANSNTAIGLGASGTNTIPVFMPTNTGTNAISGTITVTPVANGCSGANQNFTITVNPSPAVIFTPGDQTICSGATSSVVDLSSSTPGTITYSWSTTQPTGITGVTQLSGTNQIPAQTLTNSTSSPIIVTYTATAQSTVGGCQGIPYNYLITVNPVPSITTTQQTTICSGSTFNVVPVDGGGNIVPSTTHYSWSAPVISPAGTITGGSAQSGNSISQTLTNSSNAPATATYTVTPEAGLCSGTSFPVVVTVNPSPDVQFSAASQTICSGTSSSAVTLTSSAIGTVSFNWTAHIPAGITGATILNGITNTIPVQTFTNTTTSALNVVYTVTASIDNGISCPGQSYSYTVTVNPPITISSSVSNYNGFNISENGASDGWITVSTSGGSGSYTYAWTGPNGFAATTSNIANLSYGNYQLTISDGVCADTTIKFTLKQPLPLFVAEDPSAHVDVKCNGASTGVIKIDITQESVSPYSYLLTSGGTTIATITNTVATSETFTGLPAGTYNVRVTDANGSTKLIAGIIITQPTAIAATTSILANVSCSGGNNGSASVTAGGGTAPLSYSWSTTPVQTTDTASNLAAGVYTVTITDANSCSLSIQATITEPTPLATTISHQTNVKCYGDLSGSAMVVASGGTAPYAYSWNTSPVQTTVTATGLAAGNYQATVTDAHGCTKIQNVTITQPVAPLSCTISNHKNVSCSGGSDGNATVTATGGTAPYTYSWNTSPVQTATTATGLAAGKYTVLVTDAHGCQNSDSITITQPLGIKIVVDTIVEVKCAGDHTGSATITATGGTGTFNYSWNTTPVQTVTTATELAAGTYIVSVTDANNCPATEQITVTEPPLIVPSITARTNVDCYGKSTGSATVGATGGTGTLTYTWDTTPVQTGMTATGLAAGTYHATVTDEYGCSKVQTVVITQPADIIITTVSTKNISCFGNADGAISIAVTGGTGAYSYSWTKDGSPYAATENISGLAPGVYQVTVTDANNCGPKTSTYTITQQPALAVSLASQTNILCNGDSTGAINVNVTGGNLIELSPGIYGYTYSWTGANGFSSTLQNINNIPAGVYTLTVTDRNGCSQTFVDTITQPSKIAVTYKTTPVTCYGGNNASITLMVSGGVAPYAINWSNMGRGPYQDNLTAGNYTATITDANGCIDSLTINIAEAPIFTIFPVQKNITCNGADNGSIVLNIVGGKAPVSLTWYDSSTDGNARYNLAPGTYTVSINDATPCNITRSFVITEPLPLAVSAHCTNALVCSNPNSGSINLVVTGGTLPYSYAWSNGATTQSLTDIQAGTYALTITDADGCTYSAQYVITRPAPITISGTMVSNFNCSTEKVTEICTAQVSGGFPPYKLSWSSGTVNSSDSDIMVTDKSGMVVFSVTDALGCTASYTFNVEVPSVGISDSLLNCNLRSYQFYALNPDVQGENSTFYWDFGDSNSSTLQNPQHIYTTAGNYKVQLTVTNSSCTALYTKTIAVEGIPVLSISPSPQFCIGDSLVIYASGAYTYLWNNGHKGDSTLLKQKGDYSVVGTTQAGCYSTLNFTATYYELYNYTVQTDKSEVSPDQPALQVWSETVPFTQYYWNFGDGLTEEGNDISHTYNITQDGYYDVQLRAINPFGCIEKAIKRIWITNTARLNTFTPNGDGINDIFMKGWHIKVYNRNGLLLYDGSDGWDGTYKGSYVAKDTYFYVMYYSSPSGMQTKAGYVMVAR